MRWKRVRWVLLGFLLGLLALGGTWAYRVFGSFASPGMGIGKVSQAIADPRSLFPGRSKLTILVLGRDYDRDRRGMPHSKQSRADTIMLLSVDLDQRRMAAVSIPRDTKATGPDGITGKINGILSRGGVDMMKQTLMNTFGVFVDYYVLLKPDAVRAIVDELGGVEVETLDEMHYDDNWGQLHIHLPKGRVKVNGEQAVGYVRFRETSPKYRRRGRRNQEEGDLRRTARQQQMIRAMMAAGTTPGNLWKADKIIETGFQQIETDLARPQVLALAMLLKDSRDQMLSATLPGEDSMQGGVYLWVLDEVRSQMIIDWLIRGDEMAGRRAAKVAVYNASKVMGAARALAAQLYTEGYEAFSAGNAKKPVETTEVLFHRTLHEMHAREIARSIGAQAKKEPIDARNIWGPDISIRVGPDKAQELLNRSAGMTMP